MSQPRVVTQFAKTVCVARINKIKLIEGESISGKMFFSIKNHVTTTATVTVIRYPVAAIQFRIAVKSLQEI